MLTVTRTLDQLVDDALVEIARYDERGYRVVTTVALGAADTSVTIDNGLRVSISDVIELDAEIVLVTGKSADPNPVLTIARGYDGSTATTHLIGIAGTVNPMFSRRRTSKAVVRAFARLDANKVFNVKSVTVSRDHGIEHFELPEDCRDVLRVGTFDTYGRFEPAVTGWRFFDDIPISLVASGRIVRVPRYVMDTDVLVATYRTPFRWSTFPAEPTGSATITMPEGTEDLPSLYAVAWLCSRRELSRQDIDRSQEWNRSQQNTNGITSGLVKQMWSEFYRAVDEASRLYTPQIPRPFIRQRRYL